MNAEAEFYWTVGAAKDVAERAGLVLFLEQMLKDIKLTKALPQDEESIRKLLEILAEFNAEVINHLFDVMT